WTDNAGTLGDSLLNESGNTIELRSLSGGVGVNPTITNPSTNPGFAQFQFYPAAGPNANMSFAAVPRGAGAANNHAQISVFKTDFIADPNNYEFLALRARDNDFALGTGKSGTGQNLPLMLAAGFLSDNLTNNGQLYLSGNGRVGIGTTTPTSLLDVAGDINTSTQYNIGGQRVVSVLSAFGTFVGINAGTGNFGTANSFFGNGAGAANTSGPGNSFFGRDAGHANQSGDSNSFFGEAAGLNSTGSSNSFFGSAAGFNNVSGSFNTFVGNDAGLSNTNEAGNTLIGAGTRAQ